ncbi:hypothetical protein GW891_00370 [bacterium]|nr:hypothetical protein [bacterium]
MIIDVVAIIIAGIAAISVPIEINDLNAEYQIQNQIIIIDNCLRLNHSNIGSSFSI